MDQLQVSAMDHNNVFLLGDTYEPDIVSLLLKQAGDVESNPGPDIYVKTVVQFSRNNPNLFSAVSVKRSFANLQKLDSLQPALDIRDGS